LLTNHISPGVDEAAYVKAGFLNAIITGDAHSKAIDKVDAVKLLGMMLGGYNVSALIEALKHKDVAVAQEACDQLKNTLLVYDSFNDVKDLMDEGNSYAKELIESWANAEWFKRRKKLPEELKVTVFRVPGEPIRMILVLQAKLLQEVIYHCMQIVC
jgi:aconitate hydratase 2/2-methylisocitrate dehydratase